MNLALVVPSCRPEQLAAFLEAWEPVKFWDQLVVVEGDEVPADRRVGRQHYGWPEVEDILGEQAWIISRRDSARRSFGFLAAWWHGADVIVTLDDDTRPVEGQDYLAEHRRALFETPRWTSPVRGFVPRGLPYRNLGTARVGLSVGLWSGIPDQDAAHQLVMPIEGYRPPAGQWVLPAGQFFPLCGMNLAFPRELAPLMYFGLQGEPWPYARFDDIWGLLIAQKIMAHLGWSISCGRPWVRHERASDPFVNLIREAPGVKFQETFWSIVDAINLTARTPAGCMAELGAALATHPDAYTAQLGQAIVTWAGLFGEPRSPLPEPRCPTPDAESASGLRFPQAICNMIGSSYH